MGFHLKEKSTERSKGLQWAASVFIRYPLIGPSDVMMVKTKSTEDLAWMIVKLRI